MECSDWRVPIVSVGILQMLSHKYRLFLLTNTTQSISAVLSTKWASFFSDFYQCFEKVYYSYEMGMRKPSPEIFNYIINKHDLSPKRTLFVDDKKEIPMLQKLWVSMSGTLK
jgi:putative hydrolase of the HAD superfamily